MLLLVQLDANRTETKKPDILVIVHDQIRHRTTNVVMVMIRVLLVLIVATTRGLDVAAFRRAATRILLRLIHTRRGGGTAISGLATRRVIMPHDTTDGPGNHAEHQ